MPPACGAASVLKTNAESGALAEGGREAGSFFTGSMPVASPRSTGEGSRSTMASRIGWTAAGGAGEGGEEGKDPAGEAALPQAAHQVLVGQRALFEEGLHQVLV